MHTLPYKSMQITFPISNTYTNQKLSRQETPNSGGGAKGDETSGGDDGDDDTQMRAQRSRHMRAHMGEHTYESTHMRGQRRRHI